MKHILSWFIIIALIIGVIWFFWAEKIHAPVVPSEISAKLSPEMANDPAQMLEVTLPTPDAEITSPLTITGRARGPWYFEASFPIELIDNNGALIAMTTAQAQGEWMTENWVPFTATITFPAQPAGSLGKLVMKKDNPSGEPQNEMSFIVPVQF
ncbi:Gmad2 immunoglobulin-like domain-containing protein [Candidatus Peribacteria bacterium]|nr:Gmad2 immunoglobulin-like domain-containing protein [Candidatus Peribacteria bacterium]